MELKQYASILWHWAWLIVIGTVLAAGTAFGVSWFQQPVYSASATLLINQAPSANVSDYTSILTSERLARTYSELLTKRTVLEQAIQLLALDVSPESLAKRVEVQLVRDTQLIEISVEDTDPQRAATLANLIPQVFIQQNDALQASRYAESKQSLAAQLDAMNAQILKSQAALDVIGTPATAAQEVEAARLQSDLVQYRQSYTNLLQSYESIRLAEAQNTSNVTVVEPATAPGTPVRPRILVNTALAGVVGAMLAVGAIFLIEYLDDTIKSPDQVTGLLGVPMLGAIARLSADQMKNGPVALSEPLSPVTEGYRALRTNIRFYSVDRPLRSILITSAGPAEGKSTIAANLAVVVAQAGFRVVLVDADLRRPNLHRMFKKANHFGLTDAVLQTDVNRWETTPQPVSAIDNLSIVTSGALPPNPAELLGSESMARMLDYWRNRCDLLIIDTPPLNAVTDAAVLAGKTDGVLLVVDGSGTRIGEAMHAREQLDRVGANLLGVIMNKISSSRAVGGYYYHYYYQYQYHYRADSNGNGNGRRGILPLGSRSNGSGQAESNAPSRILGGGGQG